MALPDPGRVAPANDQDFVPVNPFGGATKSPGVTNRLDAFMQRFEPHQNDHGSSMFNHPSTNRGGSPVRAPERGRPSTPGGSQGGTPGRRIDITLPPNIGPTGAPRRAGGPTR